ncbi:MAG: SCO family protein [Pseudobdellovibrionaceae bacterium]
MKAQNRSARIFFIILIGLALAGLVAFTSSFLEQKNGGVTEYINAPKLGQHFDLVDQDGKDVTEKTYADKYRLIYFGFASCPAICPTELQKVASAYTALPKDLQAKIQPIFITVDPERDTPEVLKDYVALFLPNMIGLTGSMEQVDAAKKSFKVYAQKVPEGDSYTMDHSSFIYYQKPDGQTLAIFKTKDTADDMKIRILELQGLD